MNISLLRHGIAIDRDEPGCPADPERFLTERGIERTRAAVAGIAILGIDPAAILSSPYVRARQTAELAAEALGFEDEIETDAALIWDRPPERIASRLAGRLEESILLVGHAPHLDELAGYLVGADRAVTSMKKSALLVLSCFSVNRGGGYITGYYPPRLLRSLG
jgi:phosphohistidine phosphatase